MRNFTAFTAIPPKKGNGSQTIVCEPFKVVAGVGFEPTTVSMRWHAMGVRMACDGGQVVGQVAFSY